MGVAETHHREDEETVGWRNTQETTDEFSTGLVHSTLVAFIFFFPLWMSRAAIKTEQTSTLHSEEQKHLLYKAGTLLPTNTLLSNMASSLLRQNRKTFWLKAPRSMKHEESLRYRRRTDCYSGKHVVIQRPHTSGGKCLGGKSVFVNDMGQLFWGRLDLCTHLQASSLNLGRGFVFHSALPLLIHSDLPLLLWVIQSSLDGNLFTLCSACQIVDIGGGKEVISLSRAMHR